MRTEQFRKGDPVIFTKTKFSAHPGPRAEHIDPSSHGETYSYLVKKFWTVIECGDDHLVVQTRRGKRHRLNINDPALRTPNLWEQLRYRERFPRVDESEPSLGEPASQN